MASSAFSVADSALRAKRRAFSNELTAVMNKAKSEAGLSKEGFEERQGYFEQNWTEIVTSTEDCVKLIDDGDDDRDEQVNELKYQIEIIKEKKNIF